jgi:hypothetical protein
MSKIHSYFIILCLSIVFIIPAGAEAREIWLNPVEKGKKVLDNWGGVKIGNEVHFHWRVPDDFDDTTGTATLVLIGLKNQQFNYRVKVSVTQNGQPHDKFQETSDSFTTLVAGQLQEIDVSDVLPTLLPGDYVALNFEKVGNKKNRKKMKAMIVGMRYAYVDQQQTLLAGMSRTGNDIFFDGVNVHVRSGSGATNGDTGSGPSVNGLGNIIVGYDEARTVDSNKTGSHNLVVGPQNNYSSYGGLVAGVRNWAFGPNTSVSGGFNNAAAGEFSSVSGGEANRAFQTSSSISGGFNNEARGEFSSVSGGVGNEANDVASSVSGGEGNTASGYISSVSGGEGNTASGDYSSVSGGNGRTASGNHDWVAGSLFQDN